MVAIALILAAVVGFSLQRGGICAVLAVDEVIHRRGGARFVAFIECGGWVLGVLLVADAFGLAPLSAWQGFPLTGLALLGGVLFGLGAVLNGACAFGTVGHIGRGETAYLLVIPGFLAGAWLTTRFLPVPTPAPLDAAPVVADQPWHTASAVIVFGFVLWSLARLWRARRAPSARWRDLPTRPWPPAAAMAVIGVVNAALMVMVGPWAYTVLLGDLAGGWSAGLALRCGLFAALLAGAVAGAVRDGRFRPRAPTLRQAMHSLAGGALMGVAGRLIPGGNDSLVLNGLPLLWPHAWAAYGALCLAIFSTLWLLGRPGRRDGRQRPSPA